jgi:hypothetical protein
MKQFSIFLSTLCLVVFCVILTFAQAPQKLNYQSVVFDSQNALVRNTAIGLRISILQNSLSADPIFQEVYSPNPITNANGVVTVEIGTGNPVIGAFELIDWATGPYFIKSETDITGGLNYTIIGSSEILSTPYALFANKSADSFSGNYDDLTNKPSIDGTETKIIAGSDIQVTGSGSIADPYMINAFSQQGIFNTPLVIAESQAITIPQGVSKIKVELWGGSGGGGGAGTFSYSYNLLPGGSGGGGGYASQTFDVTPGQQFDVTIGAAGSAGSDAVQVGGNYIGDTDGGDGGSSFFSTIKAAGGTGGKRGGYTYYTINGLPGTDNIGSITAHPSQGGMNNLNVYSGIARSYLAERQYTSAPGSGGQLYSYSAQAGEGGAAIITFLE